MEKYQKTIKYLNMCIERDALAHAYIFYGPDNSSQHQMALWFANKILSAQDGKFPACQQAWHPDLFYIKPDANEEISISLIRQLKNFLILRPYSGEYKIVVMEAAEKLNPYAQNALLKIFEEAPNHAIIILGVKTLDSIPNTIVSRAVKLPFWQIQSESSLPSQTFSDIFELFLKNESSDKYIFIEKFNSYKALEIFGAWLNFLRIKFKINPTKKLGELLAKSQNIYFKLNETNINPKFAYDELILSLWKI